MFLRSATSSAMPNTDEIIAAFNAKLIVFLAGNGKHRWITDDNKAVRVWAKKSFIVVEGTKKSALIIDVIYVAKQYRCKGVCAGILRLMEQVVNCNIQFDTIAVTGVINANLTNFLDKNDWLIYDASPISYSFYKPRKYHR